MYTVIHRPDGAFELRVRVPPEELPPRASARLRRELRLLLGRLSPPLPPGDPRRVPTHRSPPGAPPPRARVAPGPEGEAR